MSFWLTVVLCYLMLLGLGLAAGAYFGSRGRGGHGRDDGVEPVPVAPTGPAHAIGSEPLGSVFDRAFLPAAFADDEVLVRS